MPADKGLTTSALLRSLKLGGLVGRVGVSLAANRLLELGRSDAARREHRSESLVRNAQRVVETLGELKGAAMKVGQMLSLHEGLLPPEVSAVLRALQKEAPRVPPEVMRDEVEGALGDFDAVFASMEAEGFAAASIGQVHRATLRDGRRVAVKIQYPLIDHIVKADLDNLRRLFKALFALISDVDVESVWEEVRDRLLEELDYTVEADSMRRMADLHATVPEIVIPAVIDEASAKSVLTMEYRDGIPPDEACSERYPAELRNRWGQVLLEFALRGLLEHRFLHADPNLANFAFLPDGRVIVYDFGCMKQVPAVIARGYAALFLAVLEGRKADVGNALLGLEVSLADGSPLPGELTDDYADVFAEITRSDPPYTFGENELYQRLVELGMANWTRATDIRFPRDLVFIDRAFAGHIGNLSRLKATGPWRAMIERYSRAALAATSPGKRRGPAAKRRAR